MSAPAVKHVYINVQLDFRVKYDMNGQYFFEYVYVYRIRTSGLYPR